MTAYYEHKYADEGRTQDVQPVLTTVNQLQRRLSQLEQESKQMREAINSLGQHLLKVQASSKSLMEAVGRERRRGT